MYMLTSRRRTSRSICGGRTCDSRCCRNAKAEESPWHTLWLQAVSSVLVQNSWCSVDLLYHSKLLRGGLTLEAI